MAECKCSAKQSPSVRLISDGVEAALRGLNAKDKVGGGACKTLSRLEGHSGSLNGLEGGGVVMGVIPPALAGKLSVSWRIL